MAPNIPYQIRALANGRIFILPFLFFYLAA